MVLVKHPAASLENMSSSVLGREGSRLIPRPPQTPVAWGPVLNCGRSLSKLQLGNCGILALEFCGKPSSPALLHSLHFLFLHQHELPPAASWNLGCSSVWVASPDLAPLGLPCVHLPGPPCPGTRGLMGGPVPPPAVWPGSSFQALPFVPSSCLRLHWVGIALYVSLS